MWLSLTLVEMVKLSPAWQKPATIGPIRKSRKSSLTYMKGL